MATKLLRLQKGQAGPAIAVEKEMDETVQELETRVATLESQREVLQSKLNLARQQVLDLGARSQSHPRGRAQGKSPRVRRVTRTAPPRYGNRSRAESREETERLPSRSSGTDAQKSTVADLEVTAQSLRDMMRVREREMEEAMREFRRQQVEEHRVAIQENVDVIRLQKQLSDKSAALLIIQEKFNVLQQSYEAHLEQSQRSLKESQQALLDKVGELTEQLKNERQKTLTVEGQLAAATRSLQVLEEFQERVNDLEKERNLLKDSYDRLLKSTLSTKGQHTENISLLHADRSQEEPSRTEPLRLEEELRALRWEKEQQQEEKEEWERMRREKGRVEEQWSLEQDTSAMLREKRDSLEKEVLRYKKEVRLLQEKVDSVTKAFDMSVEDLSETLLQIKAFRQEREEKEKLHFLGADGKEEDCSRELVDLRASHAETVLELQKTREMLQIQCRINNDFQAELNNLTKKGDREKEENKKRIAEKDRLLERKDKRIIALQAQLKELAYSRRNYKQSMPVQYSCAGDTQGEAEDDIIFGQLQAGESLLEIHLRGASFTPAGLRHMRRGLEQNEGDVAGQEVVTFCTYALLDFEMHSTPLVSGVQANYGFTSRYPLSRHDLSRLDVIGGKVKAEVHQALGGIHFITCGHAWIPLSGALEKKGVCMNGRASIKGFEDEVMGVLEFWVRLYPPVEPVDRPGKEWSDTLPDRQAVIRTPIQGAYSWKDRAKEEMFDFGGGIPNELEVVLERCVGLSTRWPGLLPDAYLLYRLYDLPPHVSPTVPSCTDPVFNDSASYPLAVSSDVLAYLQGRSLWVYVFDDSDDRVPPAYLAKTPIPLRALAVGRHIRGDFVLRDSGGSPRGMVRVYLRWKYPFQPPEEFPRWKEMNSQMGERTQTQQRPIAKPRSKAGLPKHRMYTVEKEPNSQTKTPPMTLTPTKRSPRTSPERRKASPERVTPLLLAPERDPTTPIQSPARKRATPLWSPEPQSTPPHHTISPAIRSLHREGSTVEDEAEEDMSVEGDVQAAERKMLDSEASETNESTASSGSDVIIMPRPSLQSVKGTKLRVEILSLSFFPTSRVALDHSVQQVYVEYRLLGIPMETTETPVSLRKPTDGEEIHYNFTRVIYVDSAEAGPLRQYLYTMLEGTDPNQGRLKFTVVSEPLDEGQEECVDIGHAHLNLQELLLTGNDVTERQIDIVSVGEEAEVVGKLKVSLEAAQTLARIYWEHRGLTVKEGEGEEEEGEAEAGHMDYLQADEHAEDDVDDDDDDEDN